MGPGVWASKPSAKGSIVNKQRHSMKKDRRLPKPLGFNKSAEAGRKRRATETIIEAIRETIHSIPRGRVASYGQVAAAAGYPKHIRMVPRVLGLPGGGLPWHRVLGSGGVIKVPGEHAAEQRLRLQAEGVRFKAGKADLAAHQHDFLA
jgi:methylated-DNA-protein-cysteine methyltransferase related protein